MHMDDIGAACPFMEVVHILGDDRDIVPLLQFSKQSVSMVRLGLGQLKATPVVEIQHGSRVLAESLRCRQVYAVILYI